MDFKIEYIFNTKQNKRCISIENYIFSEFDHLKNGSFRFRCTNKKYTESVLVNSTINKILSFSNNNIHNHEPITDHNLTVQCVRTVVKKKAEEDLHARPNKIIRKENAGQLCTKPLNKYKKALEVLKNIQITITIRFQLS